MMMAGQRPASSSSSIVLPLAAAMLTASTREPGEDAASDRMSAQTDR